MMATMPKARRHHNHGWVRRKMQANKFGSGLIALIERPSTALRYGVALGVFCVGTILSVWLWESFGRGPLMFFITAVALSAWFGGLWPGLLTTVLSMVALQYLIFEPRYSFALSTGDAIIQTFFLMTSSLISFTQHTRLWSRRRLKETAAQLKLSLEATQAEREKLAIEIANREKAEAERAGMSQQLEAEQRRLNAVLQNIPGIVFEAVGDPATTQLSTFINKYAEELLGYTQEEWQTIPNLWLQLVHPDDKERAVREAQEIVEAGKPGVTRFRWIRKDGKVIHVESRGVATRDEKTNQIVAYGVTMDITDRKLYEDRLAQAALRLRRSNDELQQFAYVASHDLQEPLRMITSYLQLVEQRYAEKLDDDAREFIQYAVEGASRMKSLINALLTYSRVESGEKDFARVNCKDAIEQALYNLQLAIEDCHAQIDFDDMPEIQADERQLVQLFQNLIGNAIKFRREDPPKVHIGAKREKDEWVFSVQDNGIGIEKQYLDRIFAIFQRLHARSKYEGTGIGLAICKKVVERHNGRIWVESEVGQGTTFYFALPA
jgi:PAS domain S-box-containing protein